MGKRIKRYLNFMTAVTAAIIIFIGSAWNFDRYKPKEAYAAEQSGETVDFRIISTTDLHGQINGKDYEKGTESSIGLARAIDLIESAREEVPDENSITLDAGDALFDYTTEYIFAQSKDEIQPIYKAMAKVGYDAITLGNHDFDYGFDYIKNQLDAAGLRDIAVVSNVTDSKTGSYPFLENMLITRKMTTASGKVVEVKIGIIGQTIPTLASKTQSYTGVLKTEDMVENAKTQAVKLKEMGADIVIALSHTGIGPENPELNFKNEAYALTKIPEIDVVVCGHEHNLFPTTDKTSPYFKLSGVDKKTYLMNGKNVIMAGNRGGAVGVVDLSLVVNGDKVEISDRKSEIRKVTAYNSAENSTIASLLDGWNDSLKQYTTNAIGYLNDGEEIQNYSGILGDNTSIQLLNDSKMDYALNYVNTAGTQYKDYPIIAASTYGGSGSDPADDYISIKDKITEADLSKMQPYNNYIYIYTITGKQLREWLEWSASAYETIDSNNKWADPDMSELMKSSNLKSLISEAWLEDWGRFYIFDGINYVINPSVAPSYDISGNRINSTRRIQSVSYKGQEVKDDQVFLLAVNKITQPSEANKGVETQVVLNGFTKSQTILTNYVEELSKSNAILPKPDNNWKLSLPKDYKFLVRQPAGADSLFKKSGWFVNYLTEKNQFRYYTATYPLETSDKEAPNIIVEPLVTGATTSPFNVAVYASDASEIKLLKGTSGDLGVDYDGWIAGTDLTKQQLRIWENGVYSIYAEDKAGNKAVRKLIINNFTDKMLSKPKIDTYTNRKTKITGTAEPGTTLAFEAYTGFYETKVDITGKFSYALPSQPSGSVVYVYVKDDEKGLVSEKVPVQVKRTGPNQPEVNKIYNNSVIISGNTNDADTDTVIAVIDDTVYVSKNGGKGLYEANTEIYNPELTVAEADIEVSDKGFFTIVLPSLEAGKNVTIYGLDHISRNSRSVVSTITEVAPNTPVVYEVSNIEKSLAGYIPGDTDKSYNVTLDTGNNTYTAKTDKTGAFTFELTEQLRAGQKLTVTATSTKDGEAWNSFPAEVTVNDIETYVKASSDTLVLNRTTDQSTIISGFYYEGGQVYLAIAEGAGDSFKNSFYTLDTDFMYKFRYEMKNKLAPGTVIYVMSRFTDGKILEACKATVIPGMPDTPVLLKEITNSDKLVKVIAGMDCEITLNIGSKTYTTKEYTYDEANDRYIYSMAVDRELSGTKVTVISSNVAGTSDTLTTEVMKAAPDAPKVNAVKAGAKTIKGKIELFDYVPKEQADTEAVTGEVPEAFKNAPSKVANTQTRVFAQIGKKTYEGKIDNKGSFSIAIPKQKAGVSITVWGSNKAGRGPLVKLTVVK